MTRRDLLKWLTAAPLIPHKQRDAKIDRVADRLTATYGPDSLAAREVAKLQGKHE